MIKRALDFILSVVGLFFLSPILCFFIVLVWLQDRCSPFYIAPRVGKDKKNFSMIKLRSMVVDADKSGVDSTANDDERITAVGRIIRRFKFDEFMQLLNVVRGEMSLVGPRPNVAREVALYTDLENELLSVKPGITDFSSIVFADEAEIISGTKDPDLAYNQLIRPHKSKLGLFYIDHISLALDLIIIFITIVGLFSRSLSIKMVVWILRCYNAPDDLVRVASRKESLIPCAPPGAVDIVSRR